MALRNYLILLAGVVGQFLCEGQVVFEEEPPHHPHGPHERRPLFQFQFQQQRNPNNQREFGFGGFGNSVQHQQQPQQQQQPKPSSDNFSGQPDCETYDRNDGFCTPLTNCGRLEELLRRRGPLAAARFLRRSICGFDGMLPRVCCPLEGRFQNNQGEGEGHPPPSSPPFTTPTPVPPPPQPFPTQPFRTTTFRPQQQWAELMTTKKNIFEPQNGGFVPRPTSPAPVTPAPPKTPFNGGGVTLIPPKPKPSNGGGGLVIITPPSTNPGQGISLIPSPPQPPPADIGGISDRGLPNDCGFSNASHTRIVGGHPATKGAWPWIAALGYRDDTGSVNYLCGGALVSKDYVLTAGHCVHKREDLVSIRLGDHDLFTDADGMVPLELEIAEVIKHPQYNPATFYNDIALIRLRRSVPFTKEVHPICLPSTPQLRTNKFEDNTPFVAGWGAIQFNGPSSSFLKEVQLPVVSDSVCQEKFKSFRSVNVDDTNICAGFAAGGKDACQGDSGGPLMQPVGNNKYVLIGIVSFGFKCAEAGYPGVYSRVTTHLPWIERTIK